MRYQEGRSERAIFVIDKRGVIQYIDIHDIDQQPDNEELRTVIRKIDPEVTDRELPEPVDRELPHGGIIVYCTSWCSDCKRARAWLKAHNLKYTEVDVTTHPRAVGQVRKWANGELITPIFDIDGEIIVDFDEDKVRQVLKGQLND